MPIVTRRAKSIPSMRSRKPWTKCWRDCSPSVTTSMPAASWSRRATTTASRCATRVQQPGRRQRVVAREHGGSGEAELGEIGELAEQPGDAERDDELAG